MGSKKYLLSVVMAVILFIMTMIDMGDIFIIKDELVICQFGDTEIEFIMSAKLCRDDGGTPYHVQ